MKVQRIETKKGYRYLLLDNDFNVIVPVRSYLKYLDNIDRAANTIKNYAHHLKIYFEYLDAINVEYDEIAINGNNPIELLGEFASWLEDPTSIHKNVSHITSPKSVRTTKTINVILTTVLGFYDYLTKTTNYPQLDLYKKQRTIPQYKSFLHELMPSNNLANKSVLLRREINKPIEYITREQYDAIIDHCYTFRDKAIISIMFEAGLRIGEVLGLYIEDIEVFNNKIKIVPRENHENNISVKNKAGGEIYVHSYVMKYISEYIVNELGDTDTNYLFVNLKGKNKGKPIKSITIQKLFERISADIGIKITPHLLRHGHGTELAEAGWDPIKIKDRLRHTHVNSTDVYIHLTDNFKKESLKKFYEDKDVEFNASDATE